MQRRFILALCVSMAVGATPLLAQSAQEKFVDELHLQGFNSLSISRTWLGRTRITGSNGTFNRELIFNTRSGEILRDYWEPTAATKAKANDSATTTELMNPNDMIEQGAKSDSSDNNDSGDGSSSGGTENGGGSGSGDSDGGSGGGSGGGGEGGGSSSD